MFERDNSGKLFWKYYEDQRKKAFRDIDNVSANNLPWLDLEFPDGQDWRALNTFNIKTREGRKMDFRKTSPLFA